MRTKGGRIEAQGGWFMEIRWPGWKHAAACYEERGGLGLWKTSVKRGPTPGRSLIYDFEGRTRREQPHFAIVIRGSLSIHLHRVIICILNGPPRDQRARVVFQNLLSQVDPVTPVNNLTSKLHSARLCRFRCSTVEFNLIASNRRRRSIVAQLEFSRIWRIPNCFCNSRS